MAENRLRSSLELLTDPSEVSNTQHMRVDSAKFKKKQTPFDAARGSNVGSRQAASRLFKHATSRVESAHLVSESRQSHQNGSLERSTTRNMLSAYRSPLPKASLNASTKNPNVFLMTQQDAMTIQ